MSHISIKEFSEIRKSVTQLRAQIVKEIGSKKTISKKQCLEWVDNICDLIITYDPVLSLSTPSIQPFIKLVDINANNNLQNRSNETLTSSSTKENDNELIDIMEDDNQTVAKSSASDNRETTDGIRYKGVIRGIDSLKNGHKSDDEWSETIQSKSPVKRAKTTTTTTTTTRRSTRNQTTKASNGENESNPSKGKDSDDWKSGGQVLGGDTPSEASSSMTAEERRRLLAEKTEQRLAQMTTRGAKGVVRLSTRAKPDIDGAPNDSKLQWKI